MNNGTIFWFYVRFASGATTSTKSPYPIVDFRKNTTRKFYCFQYEIKCIKKPDT